MEWLVKLILKAVASYVSLWLSEKKAERLEVKIKKMEISRKVSDIETKLRGKSMERASDRHLNPAMWNRGVRVKSQSMFASKLLILVAVFIGGCCETKYIEGKWPVIPVPARPQLNEEPGFSERELRIVNYSITLEEVVAEYNEEARAHNAEHGYEE